MHILIFPFLWMIFVCDIYIYIYICELLFFSLGMEGETEIDQIDRISGLPDFILHRILSFLRNKEAIQTFVLSK